MALLLETTLGDLVIDLDLEGSPELCKNALKLAKARYYTQNLIYNIQANRFCQFGCPFGDGSGGACMLGLLSSNDGDSTAVLRSQQRFLKSDMGRCLSTEECQTKGIVVATEMNGIPNTIGSQILITIADGNDKALDGYTPSNIGSSSQSNNNNTTTVDSKGRPMFRSLGIVSEDNNNILDQLAATYCDPDGRPYADIRIIRALVIDDPFDDPPGLSKLMEQRGTVFDDKSNIGDNDDCNAIIASSPNPERPVEEKVAIRISADQLDAGEEEDFEKIKQKEEELLKRQDKSRAVVLEMLGDLPSADIKAPENVLFVCKLNPVTEDEDLELIFSRFDEQIKVEIIRDPDTGSSLQYAFVEFTRKQQAVEAYLKMNNALVDDRRIKVDFSQSVAKVWNKYTQRGRNPPSSGGGGNNNSKFSNVGMPRNPMAKSNTHGTKQQYNRGGRHYEPRRRQHNNNSQGGSGSSYNRKQRVDGGDSLRGRPNSDNNNRSFPEDEELDQFGRRKKRTVEGGNNHNDSRGRSSRGGQGREDDRHHRRRSRSRDRDTHRHDNGDGIDDDSRRRRDNYHGNKHRRHDRSIEDEDRRRGNSDGDMHHHRQRRPHRHEEKDEMMQDRKQRGNRYSRRSERSESPPRRGRRSPRSGDDEEGDNGSHTRERRDREGDRDDRRRQTSSKRKSRHHERHRDNSEGKDGDSVDSRRRRRSNSNSNSNSNSRDANGRKERHHHRSRHHHHRNKESSSSKHSRRKRSDSDNDGSDDSQGEGRRRKQRKDDDDERRDSSRNRRHHRHHSKDDDSQDRDSERKKSKRSRHKGDDERRNERKRRRRRSRSHSRSRS